MGNLIGLVLIVLYVLAPRDMLGLVLSWVPMICIHGLNAPIKVFVIGKRENVIVSMVMMVYPANEAFVLIIAIIVVLVSQ